ncbi:MAG: hypothetical protein LBD79_10495 [Treponema sp.]|nr:hypothetical protein [Treponema sp.]
MKTPISYYGGKQQLAKTILSLIPEHRLYCEPMLRDKRYFSPRSRPKLRSSMILTGS